MAQGSKAAKVLGWRVAIDLVCRGDDSMDGKGV